MNSKIQQVKYMSFGSPLMDIIGNVNEEFIQENKIQLNKTIHEKMINVPFFETFIRSPDITNIPGGCQFNAMRVFNWMLENKDETDTVGFLGSVGEDEIAIQYTSLLDTEGIISYFETIREEPTGTCLVVCCNKDRAHITELGASTKISSDYVDRVLKHFINCELIFTELYILADQRELCFKLAEMGLDNKRIYGFNLPSCHFIKNFLDDIVKMISFADIVFANFDEAIDFCNFYGLPMNSTISEMVKELAKLPKINKNKNRIFVVTAGKNPAWVCEYDFQKETVKYCESFEIRAIPESLIVDTNGAGDSFAGGFLSQYMRGKSLDECMRAGHWAASMIIQQIGFVIPTEVKYDPNMLN